MDGRRLMSRFVLLVVALTAVLSVEAPGAFSAGRSSRDNSSAVVARVSRTQARKAQRYWTAHRIANAIPMDMRSGGGAAVTPASATESTGFGTIAGGTTTAARVTPSADYWRNSYTSMPARAIGRIFMRAYDVASGTWYNSSCSATVIAAENKATVWTAAHCLYSTYNNAWNRNIAFCPGYKDSNGGAAWEYADCQLGVWYPKYHSVPNGWISAVCGTDGRHCTNTEYQYDFGAMVMRPYGTGTTLIQNHTGSHILRYNVTTGAHYSFGYPAESPFDGRWLYYCYGDIFSSHTHVEIPCNATGGHSGGPWLGPWNTTSGRSYLDSVNSHSAGDGYMHGPYQGATAQHLYNAVRNLSPF
jgi:V8-like Glu-specific endopeptidase